MIKSVKVLSVILSFILLASFYNPSSNNEQEIAIRKLMLKQINMLDSNIRKLQLEAINYNGDSVQLLPLKSNFLLCRKAYKKMEWWVEYYNPNIARQLNEAAILEVDEKDLEYTAACGFQVIESLLWNDDLLVNKKELLAEINLLQTNASGLLYTASTIQIDDANIWAALRIELIRIIALGIIGFDTPESGEAISESHECFIALDEIYQLYKADWKTNKSPFFETITYLKENNSTNSFDRLAFITNCYIPLSKQLLGAQKNLEIPFIVVKSSAYPNINAAIDIYKEHLFSPNVIDEFFYANNEMVYENYQYRYVKTNNQTAINQSLAELGKLLFFEPLLSINGKRSCASCHNPSIAFTDGYEKSIALNGQNNVGRNAPTIINAALNRRQFADGRAFTLESQIDSVMSNSIELHGDFSNVSKLLKKNKTYRSLFAKAFKVDSLKIITTHSIKKAIAEYERTLIGLNSKFDKYMQGNHEILNENEKAGFNLFAGKAKCATCHFLPLFNGNLPPDYVKDELEVIGAISAKDLMNTKLDDNDKGRSKLTGIHFQHFAFKVPTVRNTALTAPYMHNGIFSTLQEVIEFYNKGGAQGLGLDLPNQTLPSKPLNLSINEIEQLVAFITTLNDTIGLTNQSTFLPPIKKKKARKVSINY